MKYNWYKLGFWGLLVILVLFWSMILLSAQSGKSPKMYVLGLSNPRRDNQDEEGTSGRRFAQPAFFESLEWIDEISPDVTSREILSQNRNQINIVFSQDMDTAYTELVDWSIWCDVEGLGVGEVEWISKRHFVITINRDVEMNESISLTYRFKTEQGKTLPQVVFNYE